MFDEHYALCKLKFKALTLQSVDKGILPILISLSDHKDVVPIYSCEGHLKNDSPDDSYDAAVDSYFTFLCKDANKVTGYYAKLLEHYASSPFFNAFDLTEVPNLEVNYLLVTDTDELIGYPSFTFRIWLTDQAEKDVWLNALKECFHN